MADEAHPKEPKDRTGPLPEWEDPSSLPVGEVREFFQVLSKALRAFQLYDRNNPVYHRFLSNLRSAFEVIWQGREALELVVDEDRITWLGEAVYENQSRSDSIAFLLFKDGVREITLRKGIEGVELEGFLEVLHRAKHARGDADDLVTLLWDQDLRYLDYDVVDLLAEGVEVPEHGDGNLGDPRAILVGEGILGEEEGGGDEEEDLLDSVVGAEGVMPDPIRTEDFNPTLYALDPSDRTHLKDELEKERARDLRGHVIDALMDRLEDAHRPERQREIAEICRTLLPNLLSRGLLGPVARILEEVEGARGAARLDPEADRALDALMNELAAPSTVAELVRALEDGTVAPDAVELAVLIRNMRPRALGPLLAALETATHPTIRRVLHEAIREVASSSPEGVVRLLGARHPAVVAGAVRLVGAMALAQAAPILAGLMEEGHGRVRRAVVEVAADLPSSVLASALVRALRDEDREIRIGAARALGRTRYAPAAEAIQGFLASKEVRQADIAEKVAFFDAYARITGERGIGTLDRMLNGRAFLGFREHPEIRAAAARALGLIGTDAAVATLRRARSEQDPVVRSSVNRALRAEET